MKELDNTEEYSLPIKKEDIDFAITVNSKYNIPLDLLYGLIISFRNSKSDIFSMSEFDKDRKKQNAKTKKAIILNAKVKEILIITEDGRLKVNQSDNYFKFFNQTISIMRDDYKQYLPKSIKCYRERLLDGEIFNMYKILKDNTALITSSRNVVIGLFLVHFEINKMIKLKSEPEWEKDQQEYRTYNEFLNKRVKARLDTIFKNYTI